MYIILKQDSVFLESASKVYEIMWKELSLWVNQLRCEALKLNLISPTASQLLLTGVNYLGAIPRCDQHAGMCVD